MMVAVVQLIKKVPLLERLLWKMQERPKSDSGYDYLSVEEKECLMFLEETLDSLDTEADSGLSTDEADTTEPSKHPRTWPTRDIPKELAQEHLGKHTNIEPKNKKCIVPVATSKLGHHSFPRNNSTKNAMQTPTVFLTEARGSNADEPKALSQISQSSPVHDIQSIPNDQSKMNIQSRTSDLESVVIPPPEPFQDHRQDLHRKGLESPPLDKNDKKDAESGVVPHSEFKKNVNVAKAHEVAPVQQKLSSEVSLKPVSPKSNKKSSEQIIGAEENHQKPNSMEEAILDCNFKRGPPTAPKPRKLPPNIILKTSKSNAVSLCVDPDHKIKVLTPGIGRPRAATGDISMEKAHSLQKEQNRARREALEKLGLPLDNEKDPYDHMTKTSAHSKPRESSRTSSRESVNTDDITPVKQPEQQQDQVEGNGIHPREINSSGDKQANFKSITLERSGVGLGSYIASGIEHQNVKNSDSVGKMSFFDKITPSFLRSNRPRPASLGMGKDFVDLKGNKTYNVELEKNDKRKSYPVQHPSKLPKPPCVSVKITPKGATEAHRKEALKKLGLLKE
ncbi:specifically androgen-regulated gene protein isoform X2 [Varanus komodoensis]|uniref:specifically androgen-regulated gene protein isoform X2 n=1 Tax=Varanus komodoensis TaxID=61221 RepID=UPI001CF79003|nr:specifically androgen-regulated gene protein isoform X2 [Varanus komodoensis]